MTTTTYPAAGSLDAVGRGTGTVGRPRKDIAAKAATVAVETTASPSRSLFQRMWDAFLASRQNAALLELARYDSRLAAELRIARDRAEWQHVDAMKAEIYSRL